MLTRVPVATVSEPVLLYHLDEKRMEERFVSAPRTVLLRISMELNGLTRFGIGRDVLQWRKAWVALRIVRMLIMHRRYGEAGRIMRMARAHPDLRRGWKAFQYRARITGGRMAQTVGFCASMRRHSAKRLSLPLRTLILTYDPAYPAISGADLRNYQNALAASDLGPTMLVSIRAVARATAGNDIAMAGLEIAGEPRGPSMVSRRTDAERRIPLAARSRLLWQVRKFRPDAIIVEGIGLGALLEPLRPFARLLVLDMHNIESDLRARIREGKSFSERLLPSRFRQRKRIERQETDALRVVDRVWVCSDADRLRLERIATAAIPIDVVMNGIPRAGEIPAVLPALPGRSDGWPVMLFIAHLGYKPNIEACERLARNIFPAIRKKFPKARLILAGRSPKPVVVQLAETAGVELVQDPGDLAPLFARGHLTVIPLATGGGTRIKILEAMAWGLPVIATPVAAEGLGFTSGDGIILHESDEDLTAAAMALCSDAGRMDDLRRRAKAQVMLRYGPAAIADAVRRGMGL
ncbi:MAG: glycosyltransferase family 4 protein [Rhizobiaceae bacterium]